MALSFRLKTNWLLAASLAAAIALSLCGELAAGAQTNRSSANAVPTDAGTVLMQMASHAGVIFAGEVLAVDRSDALGFVDVRFRIDQAVRGCPRSGAYVLREWAGLWSAHPERYRVGQRFLMLLTARGPSGMSSPIGGLDGAIPLIATADQPLARTSNIVADTGVLPTFATDLRRIQARGSRASAGGPAGVHAQVVPVGHPVMPSPSDPDWTGPVAPLNSSSQTATSSPAALTAVLALLASAPTGSSDARY